MTLPAEALMLLEMALAEDVGSGDRTTLWTFPAGTPGEAAIVAKAPGVIAGMPVCVAAFQAVDPSLEVEPLAGDGTAVEPGGVVLRARGPAASILTAERTALNFLQRLSGVATETRRYVKAVEGTGARVIDTRKTTPGMRLLEKDAVRAGGGANHRFGLHDMVLIKDNHIAAAGGIAAAVRAVRERNVERLGVEVETTTPEEVEEALAVGIDRIMFDNMPVPLLARMVERVHAAGADRPETEASGGITLATIRAVAETGVDFVSVGALTHSAPALDLSLRLRQGPARG
jgi:nicotinate-nucleotide pyrophosphorylase (carboxylating)